MAMKRLHSDEAYKWLEVIKCDFSHDEQPCRVSCRLPSGYESYTKIFHPIYERVGIDDVDLTWNDIKVPDLYESPELQALMQDSTAVYQVEPDSEQTRRILWSEMCEKYRVPFSSLLSSDSFTRAFPKKSWPVGLFGPEDGALDTESCSALVSVLTKLSRDDTIFFEYDAHAWPPDWDPKIEWSDMFYSGRLEDPLNGLIDGSQNFTPTLWWPESHDWIVYSDWDLTFTLVAGSRALCEALIDNEVLETVEIEYSARVDHLADASDDVHS